ncbi:hypothetical protein AVEN_156402-1 [Araneus ventricosus]|uniref:Uncharacterized protein n=1 Tax=Araneus ventricosus TaxID=182803 RepID=A0A4Y2TZL5_ARAVE|nr:hypothetical protein AVEN_156402-1 [Araneus ventricosus]
MVQSATWQCLIELATSHLLIVKHGWVHSTNVYGSVSIRKPLVAPCDAIKRRQWFRAQHGIASYIWPQDIGSDGSECTLFRQLTAFLSEEYPEKRVLPIFCS